MKRGPKFKTLPHDFVKIYKTSGGLVKASEICGVSTSTLRKRLKEAGVKLSRRGMPTYKYRGKDHWMRKVPFKDEDKIKLEHSLGKTLKHLGDRYGVSGECIRLICLK